MIINEMLELNVIKFKYYGSRRARSIRKDFKEIELNLDGMKHNF